MQCISLLRVPLSHCKKIRSKPINTNFKPRCLPCWLRGLVSHSNATKCRLFAGINTFLGQLKRGIWKLGQPLTNTYFSCLCRLERRLTTTFVSSPISHSALPLLLDKTMKILEPKTNLRYYYFLPGLQYATTFLALWTIALDVEVVILIPDETCRFKPLFFEATVKDQILLSINRTLPPKLHQ